MHKDIAPAYIEVGSASFQVRKNSFFKFKKYSF
jgi:hypothetical protein